MSLTKYEIRSEISQNRLIIYIGNPDGDLKIVDEPAIGYEDWPNGYHPDNSRHPVRVYVEEQSPAGARQDLKFSTTMADVGANLKKTDIFCMEAGEIRRKRRGSVPVTSGGGGEGLKE